MRQIEAEEVKPFSFQHIHKISYNVNYLANLQYSYTRDTIHNVITYTYINYNTVTNNRWFSPHISSPK